ncbi:MAG: CBS domain-containing protein [Phycisphaerales bacterium]|jgi:CBS domain-containing protein|nr:CBS domain-containing protein [Phycisphaerales bacterium]
MATAAQLLAQKPSGVIAAVSPDASVLAAAKMMNARHIPLVDSGRVRGMISIGDVNARVAERQRRTISCLEQFMSVL